MYSTPLPFLSLGLLGIYSNLYITTDHVRRHLEFWASRKNSSMASIIFVFVRVNIR